MLSKCLPEEKSEEKEIKLNKKKYVSLIFFIFHSFSNFSLIKEGCKFI